MHVLLFGGIIKNDCLYCFSIGDCHITAYDSEFNTTFTTINNHKRFEDYLENVYKKNNSYDWTKAEDRVMVRRDYRNKPNKKYNGEDISFGALTGETEAEAYIDTYKVNLEKVKYICAYSDGCEPFFETKEKAKKIVLSPYNIEKSGKERTLIIFERRKTK